MSDAIKELMNLPLEKQVRILSNLSVKNEKDNIEINGSMFKAPSMVVRLIEALTDELEYLKTRDAVQKD